MIGKKIEKGFNDQINAELYSAYIYLAMSAWFASQNLDGFARWMRMQCLEEMTHADKFYQHIHQRGGRVELSQIDAPPFEWSSPPAVFEAALEHEKKVTALIHNLVELALAEKDHAAHIFLQWFVTEQVEEEQSVDEVVQKLKWIGREHSGLFMLDRQLGERTFSPSAD